VQWVRSGLEPWQLYTIAGVVLIIAMVCIYIVAREIWYAVNPDKRPLKKRVEPD
jgi:hypothetical protein